MRVRKEVLAVVGGVVEMERAESLRHGGMGGGKVTSNHANPLQAYTKAEHLQRCRLRPRPATRQERETDHEKELLTSFPLIMNCALPVVLSEWGKSFFQLIFLRLDKRATLTALERLLISVFISTGKDLLFFLLLSFVWLQSLGPPPPLCVTAPWL